MKRYGNLWGEITEFANLLSAAHKAQKGKRYRENVLQFNFNLEGELLQLQQELIHKTYTPGKYRIFTIEEPKKRVIAAAPYRDRVIHHTLCNIINPIIEKTLINDTYANRVGYGSHRALRKFTEFARSSEYVLECDISKYFPSIDHQILKSLIRRKIKCLDTLWLIDLIIDNSSSIENINNYFWGDDWDSYYQRKRGLPIGNLTSQLFANLYLSGLDHYIKEELRIKKYVRYVDDFTIFNDNKDALDEIQEKIATYLLALRLRLHPKKTQIVATKEGVNFVGFRVLPEYIRIRQPSLRRARKRWKAMIRKYEQGLISREQIDQSLQGWLGHIRHGNTRQLSSCWCYNALTTDGEI